MARVNRVSRTVSGRLNTINALRECLADLGWATQYNDISVSGGFSVLSPGEGVSPDCSPCCLLFTLGYTSYLEVDLCTWVSTTGLSGGGRVNYTVGAQNAANNLKFFVGDIAHTVTVTGNKDMLYIELNASGVAYVYRMLIARLNEHISNSGVAIAPVVVGQPIQLRPGDAENFMAGGIYCGVSHPRGGIREGYYYRFTVTSVDKVNDSITTTLTAGMGVGSVLGGNPFPWVGINIHGYSNQAAISFVFPFWLGYIAAGGSGSNANISVPAQAGSQLRPSSVRCGPASGSLVAIDGLVHGRRMVYPFFYGDLDTSYGSSEYVKLATSGVNGDYFGVNERGAWTVSASTDTTVTCNDASWGVDEHKGAVIFFNRGNIEGVGAIVTGNTDKVLSLDISFDSLPAQGDGFVLFDAFYQIAVPYSPSAYLSGYPAIAIRAV